MATVVDTTKKNKILRFTEYAYLVVLAICLLYYFESETTTFYIPWPENTALIVLGVVCVVSTVRYVVYHLNNKSNWKSNLIIVAVTLLAFVAAFFSSGDYFYDTVVCLAYLAIGAIGIDFKKIFSCYLWIVGSGFVVTVLSCLSGNIVDLIYTANRDAGFTIRASMGINYPTECGAAIFFLVLAAYVYSEKCPGWVFAIVGFAASLFCWYFCSARNSSGLLILFLILALLLCIHQLLSTKNKCSDKILRISGLVISFFAPSAALVELIVIRMYQANDQSVLLNLINIKTNGRISLAASALETYGIKLFGTYFETNSIDGISTVMQFGYNMVDFSYIRILICHGPIALLLILSGMVFVSIKANKQKNYRIVAAVFLVAAHSMLDYNMAEFYKNIFLLLPYCALEQNLTPVSEKRSGEINWKKVFLCMILPLIMVLCGNQLISILRTLSQTYCLTDGGISGLKGSLIIVFVLFMVVLFDIGICRLADHKKGGVKMLAVTTILLASMYLLIVNSLNNNITQSVIDEVQSDSECMELFRNYDTGDLYFSEFPYIYQKKYGIGKSTWMDTENLARLKKTTVVVDKELDSVIFTKKDFLYTAISDYHGLYTNDQQIIDILEDNGYILTEYNPVTIVLDNSYMAEINDLKLDADGNIVLHSEDSITNGPDITIIYGTYVLQYKIHVDRSDLDNCSGDKLASIVVTAFDGKEQIASKDIVVGDFDSDGNAVIELELQYDKSVSNVEFRLVDVNRCTIEVNSISYHRL